MSKWLVPLGSVWEYTGHTGEVWRVVAGKYSSKHLGYKLIHTDGTCDYVDSYILITDARWNCTNHNHSH